ncbi:MAG TPA: hypothetical protein VG370_09025 [Chloroflexota bacterium]|nr:hypothetical protein [Chloroflexota bacterium]
MPERATSAGRAALVEYRVRTVIEVRFPEEVAVPRERLTEPARGAR